MMTAWADQPRSAAGFPDGNDIILDPVLNLTQSADASNVIFPFDATFTASATWTHFLIISLAALAPVDMTKESPLGRDNALNELMNAAVNDLPIYLAEIQIFRFFLALKNLSWYGSNMSVKLVIFYSEYLLDRRGLVVVRYLDLLGHLRRSPSVRGA